MTAKVGSAASRAIRAARRFLRVAAADVLARKDAGAWHPAAASIGVDVALDLDTYWRKAGAANSAKAPFSMLDLFSGCGGLSAGFMALNGLAPLVQIRQAVEIDPVANCSYRLNFGMTPLAHDVASLPGKTSARLSQDKNRGRPLLLVGGPPCQGFSSHRNGRGDADVRNSLVEAFVRVGIELRASAIVMENVPELLTDQHFHHLRGARQLLEAGGYFVNVSVHNTAAFGVPQDRFRLLLLALPRPFQPLAGFLAREKFKTVRDAIGHLSPVRAGQRVPDDPLHYSASHRGSTIETIKRVPLNGGNRPMDAGPESLRRIAQRTGKPAYEDVYGRLHWDKPAITVTAYARNPASGRYVHPEQHRGLTIREAALLQGFPSSWELAGSFDDCFRQLGNAVPPPFAAYLAAHLVGQIAEPSSSRDFSPGFTEPVGPSFSRLIPALKAGTRDLP